MTYFFELTISSLMRIKIESVLPSPFKGIYHRTYFYDLINFKIDDYEETLFKLI